MKLLKRLLGGFTTRKLSDPVLGLLRFFDFGNPSKDYWEGLAFAGEDAIEVFVDAGPEGPSQRQREFFLSLVSDQDALFDQCRALLIPAWEEWSGREFPRAWRSEIVLSSLSIPRRGQAEEPWEVSFKPRGEGELLVSVVFEGGTAASVTIDG